MTVTYPSLTLSRYTNVIFNELTLSADEKIAITKLRFKQNGSLPDGNLRSLNLVNYQTQTALAIVDGPTNGIVEFIMTPDASKPDHGLVVSGGIYDVVGNIITPNVGAGNKPNIKLDLEASSSIVAFDYNNMTRVANLKAVSFPLTGPTITTF